MDEYEGQDVIFRVTEIGESETAIAVKVQFRNNLWTNNIKTSFPHITLFVNKAAGGKPVDSNQITKWTPVGDNYLYLKGVVSNVIQ